MNEQLAADCPFCQIICGDAEAQVVASWPDAVAFVPLDPVTPGHILVVPTVHVPDFVTDRAATAAAMYRAAILAGELPAREWNLITSAGAAATQTVYHLHLHLVPRRAGDGLHLPWTGQHRTESGAQPDWLALDTHNPERGLTDLPPVEDQHGQLPTGYARVRQSSAIDGALWVDAAEYGDDLEARLERTVAKLTTLHFRPWQARRLAYQLLAMAEHVDPGGGTDPTPVQDGSW